MHGPATEHLGEPPSFATGDGVAYLAGPPSETAIAAAGLPRARLATPPEVAVTRQPPSTPKEPLNPEADAVLGALLPPDEGEVKHLPLDHR